ncbi:MAG TPA: 1-acyl-sn-glycerol-3-phosphate acyltransferase [Candidatus Lokiarchaeia archaeon]|nr:1-acyl-sn-glycerol-3-phosphate acyltransferase [Candidatus Lokiarchaeia archaeon]
MTRATDQSTSTLPHPELRSWMHERIPLPIESRENRERRYARLEGEERITHLLLTRFMKVVHLPKYRWIWYRFMMRVANVYFKLVHRLEVRGLENIPKNGSIFYLLHNGDYDVIYFLGAFKEPTGVFTDVGNGFFADFLERFYGFVTRRGTRDVMVEKMIRAITTINRYFVIWPEGSPSRDAVPMEAFSGIIRVYSTINVDKDRIPFQPVLMRGSETILHKNSRRKWKILVEFLKPFYIPREWLKKPEEGGKTPREIINALMLVLARKVGFTTLKKNFALERRRQAEGRPWRE